MTRPRLHATCLLASAPLRSPPLPRRDAYSFSLSRNRPCALLCVSCPRTDPVVLQQADTCHAGLRSSPPWASAAERTTAVAARLDHPLPLHPPGQHPLSNPNSNSTNTTNNNSSSNNNRQLGRGTRTRLYPGVGTATVSSQQRGSSRLNGYTSACRSSKPPLSKETSRPSSPCQNVGQRHICSRPPAFEGTGSLMQTGGPFFPDVDVNEWVAVNRECTQTHTQVARSDARRYAICAPLADSFARLALAQWSTSSTT